MEKQIKKDIHIYIDYDTVNKVEEYASKNNISMSDAYSELVNFGLNNDSLTNKLDSIINNSVKLISNSNYNKRLLQQIYADLNLNQREPKTSANLNQFNNNYRKGKYKLID